MSAAVRLNLLPRLAVVPGTLHKEAPRAGRPEARGLLVVAAKKPKRKANTAERPPLSAIVTPPSEKLRKRRADVFFGTEFLGMEIRKRLPGADDDELREFARQLLAARASFRPKLVSYRLDPRTTAHEARAFALLQYLDEWLVLVGDGLATDAQRHEAAECIDALWVAATKRTPAVDARGVFTQAVERAATESNARRVELFRNDPVEHVAYFVELYAPELAERLRMTDPETVERLLAAWPERKSGSRPGRGAGKWRLAADLWRELTGENVKASDMKNAHRSARADG